MLKCVFGFWRLTYQDVLVFPCYYNKLAQNFWLKTTKIHYLTALKVKSMKCILKVKSRCQHNCLHSRDFRENPSLLFSESTYISCCMAPSSKDCITFCIQSQFLSSHLSDRPSFFLLIRTLRIKWAHPYNPGSSSFLKIFNLTAKSFY